MDISDNGLRFIQRYEGLRLQMYNDDGQPSATSQGNATIGIGHLIHIGPIDGRPSEAPFRNGLTLEEAYALKRADARRFVRHVNDVIKVPLNQNQFDALCSFAFNLGSLLGVATAVNGGGDVCAALKQYIKPDWARAGLLRRRIAECELYHKPYVKPAEPIQEDEDMKPYLAWNIDAKAVYLIGPFGAVWITQQEDVKTLEGLYGKMAVVLHDSTIKALAAA